MKPRTMYMHLIDGKPATYQEGEQVTFASTGRYARRGVRLVPTLAQIKKEQRASDAWRLARGFRIDLFTHSYALVEVPA